MGIIGLIGVLYAGLSWLSGMRAALQSVFEMPRSQHPNFLIGKLRDLLALVIIGITLMLSVAVTGAVVGFSDRLLDLVHAGHQLSWLVQLLGVAVGLGTNMLLFYVLFRLLARPQEPARALWQGALLGGLGFEALKLASSYLLRLTHNQPAFQAFGIALVLLIWINYFSRTVMYAAAWAHTSRPARAVPRRRGDAARTRRTAGGRGPGRRGRCAHRARPAAHLRRRRRDRPGTGGPGPETTPVTASESGISHDPCTTCRRRAR